MTVWGPVYSFHSQTQRGGESYIDHCVVSENVLGEINSCFVGEDCIMNTSDHLTVVTCMVRNKVTMLEVDQINNEYKLITWDKISESDRQIMYTVPLEEAVDQMFREI